MGHICTHAYRYASICRLGLAACMSDARPRPLNARFRSTESAAVDSFENPKIPTPKPVRFTSNENLSKNRFYNQQIANQKRTFVLVPHPARTAWIRRVGSTKRPKFAQDHGSGLRSDRGPVVLFDFSKLRLWKSLYDFLNLYGRFCPYNPPYSPGHDTLPSKMRVEIFL